MTQPIPINVPPRVLIFRNELLPSSETFIHAQADALRSFEPCFVGVHAATNSIRLLPAPTLLEASSTLAGKLRRHLFWQTSIAPAFYRTLRALQPALVHAHFALDGAAALPLAHSLHVPLLVTLHGYDVTSSDHTLQASPEGRLYLRHRERLWQHASTFLCVSQFIYDQALARGFPPDKLRLHYIGTDFELFSEVHSPRDPDLIVFVGRLVEKKGCRYLLQALAAVRLQRPSVKLVVIGAGPLEQELKDLAASTSLPSTFLGSQPPEIVKRYLAQARVFCAPSITASSGDSEGLGMVFIEAQAMGTPVVSFRHGGIPEVVLHGVTGLLAPERDTAALTGHLLTLLKDDSTWRAYSDRGQQWVRSNFDLHVQTRCLEKIYSRILFSV